MQSKNQNFLKEIIKIKKLDLIQKTRRNQKPGELENQKIKKTDLSRFLNMLRKNQKRLCLIAEIKFASPTNPKLGPKKDFLERARVYEQSGADAISLITEKHFFKGDVGFVLQVKEQVKIPVLQKDFVIDQSQIFEAKKIGSDALLLIARLVDVKTLKKFVDLCFEVGVEPVVEIASKEDLGKAIATKTKIVAVNARDLETFSVSVANACMLIKKIPGNVIKLGFSGIHTEKEVALYREAGANGILIGTRLMQTKDIAGFINNLHL